VTVWRHDVRRGDDDFCVNKLSFELRILPFLVRGGYQRVALLFKPLADSQFPLSRSEKIWLLFGVLTALEESDEPI
jgi:hypothetical protein